MPPEEDEMDDANRGLQVRVATSDVLPCDETGVTINLSDRVLSDIRHQMEAAAPDPFEVIGDLDIWDLRQEGDWYSFSAELGEGPRRYRRPIEGGDIVAAAPGPLFGLLALGGPRRAGFNTAGPAHPFNVLAPGDHIGAVGLEGTAEAQPTGRLQQIRHSTRETLLADMLIHGRRRTHAALPLYLTRAETDGSGTIGELLGGPGYANLVAALDSLCTAANRLGKRPEVLSIAIDYGLEDVASTAAELVHGYRDAMARIEREMARRDMRRPVFLLNFEAGTREIPSHPIVQAHWELAWQHGSHDLVFVAPAYMFELARFGRPTETARVRMAEMDAHALRARLAGEEWFCPLFLIAECQDETIRVTARAMSGLVADGSDPWQAGPGCGFRVLCGGDGPDVERVQVAENDPNALILTCSGPVPPGATLHYASGGDIQQHGSIRDNWSAESRTGHAPLHRWAYPAMLPVHAASVA